MTRLMACPHCGHTCKSDGIGAVYCGPHGNGQTYHPAVRMEQIEPEGHAEDHLDAATVALGECIAADRELEERRQHESGAHLSGAHQCARGAGLTGPTRYLISVPVAKHTANISNRWWWKR